VASACPSARASTARDPRTARRCAARKAHKSLWTVYYVYQRRSLTVDEGANECIITPANVKCLVHQHPRPVVVPQHVRQQAWLSSGHDPVRRAL
jgi:hypothetical protein